jgi:hypothetical protein
MALCTSVTHYRIQGMLSDLHQVEGQVRAERQTLDKIIAQIEEAQAAAKLQVQQHRERPLTATILMHGSG